MTCLLDLVLDQGLPYSNLTHLYLSDMNMDSENFKELIDNINKGRLPKLTHLAIDGNKQLEPSEIVESIRQSKLNYTLTHLDVRGTNLKPYFINALIESLPKLKCIAFDTQDKPTPKFIEKPLIIQERHIQIAPHTDRVAWEW